MIVKIKQEGIDSWLWIDGIVSLMMTKRDKIYANEARDKLTLGEYVYVYPDQINKTHESDKESYASCKEFYCENKDGKCFSIIFNSIAHICNDNGKTLKKVIA